MSNNWPLLLSAAEGVVLAVFFYGGLYLTVTRGLTSKHPALLFIASLILRLGFVIYGFYFFTGGQWQLVISCLAGFTITGIVIRTLSSRPLMTESESIKEQSKSTERPTEPTTVTAGEPHAPQP